MSGFILVSLCLTRIVNTALLLGKGYSHNLNAFVTIIKVWTTLPILCILVFYMIDAFDPYTIIGFCVEFLSVLLLAVYTGRAIRSRPMYNDLRFYQN